MTALEQGKRIVFVDECNFTHNDIQQKAFYTKRQNLTIPRK